MFTMVVNIQKMEGSLSLGSPYHWPSRDTYVEGAAGERERERGRQRDKERQGERHRERHVERQREGEGDRERGEKG